MRQPQASTSAGAKACTTHEAISEPVKVPTLMPALRLPTANPMREAGACSATNTHAPGISPPIASPCSMRKPSSNTGASAPICA